MTLVGIQGHAGMVDTIPVNAPFWPVADVVGLAGEDSPVPWPDFVKRSITTPIREGRWMGYGLRPTLLIDSIAALLGCAQADNYDSILWTECDSIFFGNIPDFNRSALNCAVMGHCQPEWGCGNGLFIHPPYVMSLEVASRLCEAAKSVSTELGNGSPDVFVPILCQQAGIPIVALQTVYSCNGSDMRVSGKMLEARSAFQAGAWHIHGIKRKDHQDFILGKTDTFPWDTLQ